MLFKKEVKGLIGYCGLSSYWNSFSKQEQRLCIKAWELGLGTTKESLLEHNTTYASITKSSLLSSIGSNLISIKEFELANKLLSESLRISEDAIDTHFILNSLINLTYLLRDNSEELDKCIHFCKMDIKLLPDFLHAWQQKWTNIPRIPSFERLAIIYEKQGNINEAIKVCEIAIQNHLKDSTKGSFEGRLSRLQKKIAL